MCAAINVQGGYRSSSKRCRARVKSLILVKGGALPRSHGGYIQKFGELYVVKGEIERGVVTRLYRALELRNKARYDPDYKPLEVDVNGVLQAYREIREIARKILEKNEISTKSS